MNIDLLLHEVLKEHAMPWSGIHGLSHWGRVLDNGMRLAGETGADPRIVTLFAVFHDSRRINDGHDPGHGLRGAQLATELRGTLFQLPDREFHLLCDACAQHTDGLTEADVSVQTCWDADRLDLGRVGITPWPDRLCTDAAKRPETIDWAHARAVNEEVSDSIRGVLDTLSAGG